MRSPGILRRGKQLFRAGEQFRALYVLRSGSVKTWNVSESGEEYVLRFYMPGDVLGLGAICDGVYDCNAMVLDTCSVCEIPFHQFQEAAEQVPALNHVLLRLMSHEIQQEEQTTLLRSNKSAVARIAGFLCRLADGFDSRGFSSTDFNLTMGRREIADYLGLALETVSRTLSQLDHNGTVKVEGRRIRVADRNRLDALAHNGGQHEMSMVAHH